MNNKEFIAELSEKLEYPSKDTARLVNSVIAIITERLQDDNIVNIQGFGTFEVKKKMERVSVIPTTKQRFLIPPKLVLTFRPSGLIKEKFKNKGI